MNLTPLPSITPVEKPKSRYGLANAWNRIFARIIDQLIVLLVAVGLACVVIATTSNSPDRWRGDLSYESWRYLVISLVTVSLFIIYFTLIPFLSKGRTIGFLIFKLSLYNLIPTRNFYINILKREFFLWMISALAILVLGIILCVLKKGSYTFLQSLLDVNKADNIKSKVSAAFIDAMYGINIFFIIFVIIHMCMNNKKRCFIDHVSDTVVIKLIDISSNDPSASTNFRKKSKRNYGLPGEILGGVSDEINSL